LSSKGDHTKEDHTDDTNNKNAEPEEDEMTRKEESDNTVEGEVSARQLPPPREDEIKNIGIIQHLTRVGEGILKIYDSDIEEFPEEEKKKVYQKYLEILQEDIAMINDQKKGYEEELPPNVVNITRPIDDNMLKVMEQCLLVINSYIDFINEEEKDVGIFNNAFDILQDTSQILDETEEMLRQVLDSVETTGGIIGEA